MLIPEENNAPLSDVSDKIVLKTSIELKLVALGMNPKAVIDTPTTDPTVLIKKTSPEPLSPPAYVCVWRSVWIAIKSGFIAETATRGMKINKTQAK